MLAIPSAARYPARFLQTELSFHLPKCTQIINLCGTSWKRGAHAFAFCKPLAFCAWFVRCLQFRAPPGTRLAFCKPDAFALWAMQILFLDSDPRTAARLYRNKRIVNKLITEVLQLIGGAIRHHCLGNTPESVSKPHSPNHVCAVWVRSHFEHFKWAVEHVSELYAIYNEFIRKSPTGHASSLKKIQYAQYIVYQVENGGLSWPSNLSADDIRAELLLIHQRQSKKAQKNGLPLVAGRGFNKNMACAVVAIDAEFRARLDVRPSDDLDAVVTYRRYHEAKHAILDAPWRCSFE